MILSVIKCLSLDSRLFFLCGCRYVSGKLLFVSPKKSYADRRMLAEKLLFRLNSVLRLPPNRLISGQPVRNLAAGGTVTFPQNVAALHKQVPRTAENVIEAANLASCLQPQAAHSSQAFSPVSRPKKINLHHHQTILDRVAGR